MSPTSFRFFVLPLIAAPSICQSLSLGTCAVIGGGVAGLSCANQLSEKFDVTVFDTGRLRPGGRSSSRLPGDPPKEDDPKTFNYLSNCIIDHAAQVICKSSTPGCETFNRELESWNDRGVLTPYEDGTLFNIGMKDNGNIDIESLSLRAYYGSKDMGLAALSQDMLDTSRFKIQQDVWVSPSSGARYMPKTKEWRITASGKVLGYFDHLVIAHNGKCADRLMSKTPAKRVHQLLRVNFSPSVAAHGGKRMTLSSIYSYSFALPKDSPLSSALPTYFKGGFVENNKSLRFLSCQTRKYQPREDVEVWTLLSSSTFAKKYKAPQEFLPEEVAEEVSSLLLNALERSTGLSEGVLRPIEGRVQLWGAALPLNVWNGGKDGYLYDAEFKVGVCGDWLVEASVGGAWTSGYKLGKEMAAGLAEDVGLEGSFVRSQSTVKSGIFAAPDKQKPQPQR